MLFISLGVSVLNSVTNYNYYFIITHFIVSSNESMVSISVYTNSIKLFSIEDFKALNMHKYLFLLVLEEISSIFYRKIF